MVADLDGTTPPYDSSDDWIGHLALSPDGRHLAIGVRKQIDELWLAFLRREQ